MKLCGSADLQFPNLHILILNFWRRKHEPTFFVFSGKHLRTRRLRYFWNVTEFFTFPSKERIINSCLVFMVQRWFMYWHSEFLLYSPETASHTCESSGYGFYLPNSPNILCLLAVLLRILCLKLTSCSAFLNISFLSITWVWDHGIIYYKSTQYSFSVSLMQSTVPMKRGYKVVWIWTGSCGRQQSINYEGLRFSNSISHSFGGFFFLIVEKVYI